MIYLVGQIFFCLALVAAVGLLVGWLLRGIGTQQREKELEATWRMRLRQRDTMLSKMANELAERGPAGKPVAGAGAVARELESSRRALRDREAQLAQLQGRVSKRDAQISQLLAEIRRVGGEPAVERLLSGVNSGTFLDSGVHKASDMAPTADAGAPASPSPGVAPAPPPGVASSPTPAVETPSAPETPPPVEEEPDPSERTHPEKISLQQASEPTHEDSDELVFIYGISPGLEKKLMKLGVRTFRQIAAFESRDIERIAGAIGIEPEQIVEENWVDGARQEHLAKYGELI